MIKKEEYTATGILFEDDFSAAEINTDNWGFEIGNGSSKGIPGWGNNELQTYDRESAFIEDGNLIIEASKGANNSYASARMTSQFKQSFKFGKIEARAQLPEGQGIWPAIWMIGDGWFTTESWPYTGEIDIVELVGGGEDGDATIHGTAHWASASGYHLYSGGSHTLDDGKFSDNFHVFAIDWNEDRIQWLIDDFVYHEETISGDENRSELADDFFFVMNVAVGGNWGGYPDETTVFSQRMVVDYVRVSSEVTISVFEDTQDDDLVAGTEGIDEITVLYEGTHISASSGNDIITLTADGTWDDTYFARSFSVNGVASLDLASLDGKNKFSATLNGGANTDTVNLTSGDDAFFLHDSFSRFGTDIETTIDTLGNQSTQRLVSVEVIEAGDGNDLIDLTSPIYSMASTPVTVNAGNGNDIIWAADGADIINAGTGDDVIFGGSGNDRLTGGDGADSFEFTVSAGSDVIVDYSQDDGDTLVFYRRANLDMDTEVAFVDGDIIWDDVTIDFEDFDASADNISFGYEII